MPRRRMIDPDFWKDHCIAALTRDERLFVIGCVSNADDEGRLEGHDAYLKAAIFMYDDDITQSKITEIKESCLQKMSTWPETHQFKITPYENSGEAYLFFPYWFSQQRPSHPTKSQLPPPPLDLLPIFSGIPHETLPPSSGESQENLAPSLVKSSVVKFSVVKEDFTKFLGIEKDLTDFLTETLTKFVPRGPTAMVEVLQQFWSQALGDRMKGGVFDLTLRAVREYPVPILARAYVKAVKYRGGKYDTAKYLDRILKEQMEKGSPGKERSPP